MPTIEPHEIEGVQHYIEWVLGADDIFPPDAAEWRSAHERIGCLLDLDDALAAATPGESIEIAESRFLEQFAREGGEYGAEIVADARALRQGPA